MSRVKVEYRTDSKENYNIFLKLHKIKKEELPYAKYSKILHTCNWMFVEYSLRTGMKATLPYGFGPIAVSKKMLNRFKEYEGKKYINLRVDWAKSRKAGKRVYHTNEHTDGFNYKWGWFPKEARFYLSNIYTFIPCRYSSRALSRYLKAPSSECKNLYLEWFKN